jgi:hypothetical protein
MKPLPEVKSDQPAVDAQVAHDPIPPYEPPVIEKLGHWQVVTLSGSICTFNCG